MTDVFYAIGRFFQWIFRFMNHLGNVPNLLIIIIGVIAICIWIWRMSIYNREADERGTLK